MTNRDVVLKLSPFAAACTAFLTACSVPAGDTTPTPTPSNDIREQVVAALQQPSKVTYVRISVDGMGGSDVMHSWLDLPGERMRLEQLLANGEPDHTVVIADGRQVSYTVTLSGGWVSEGSAWIPDDVVLPPSLHNPALRGIGPLAFSLLQGEWEPAGDGQWEGSPATLWRADFPGPEGSMHTYTTIYVDAETKLPLGEDMAFSQREGEPPQGGYKVAYTFDFLDGADVPSETFDPEHLSRQLFSPTNGPPITFPVLWLGRTVEGPEGLASLRLGTTRLEGYRDTDGPRVRLTYGVLYAEPPDEVSPRALVELTVWDRARWERYIGPWSDRYPWRLAAEREQVMVGGMNAEFVVGGDGGQRTQALVWLPESVVLIDAPALYDPHDRNTYNNEQAIRALVPLLEVKP